MATMIIVPKQGQSVEICAIMGWKKKVGDPVKVGDILCEVETDKATFEVESPVAGTMLAIFHEAGAEVPVLAPIAAVGAPGEKVERPVAAVPEAAKPAVQPPAQASRVQQRSTAIPAEATPEPFPADRGGRIPASPRAKVLAASRGISLAGIRGTGPGSRIVERDVIDAIARGHAPVAAASAASGPAGASETRLSGARKLIAERMLSSLQSSAQLTLNSSADARSLLELRKKLKESPEESGLREITINDMVLFAASRAIRHHPECNAHLVGDAIRRFDEVHLAFAVDTSRGLMAPVIRGAHALGLRGIAREAARLAAACKEGRISPEEMQGATFTVTNLGNLGVESFTPVLNLPQVAILGVGSITARAVLSEDGSARFVPHIGLSLTIDHRAVDGAPGARFLQTLAATIARFDLLLAG